MDWNQKLGRRSFPWIVVGIAALAALPVGLFVWCLTAVEYAKNPPSCYGLGWGCSLDPTSSGVVGGILWLVGVGAVAVALVITELFWKQIAVLRSVVVLIVTCVGALWLLGSALSVVAG